MRFCGGFLALEQVSCPEKGSQTHGVARKSVGSALLPVDHTDGRADDETGLTDRRDRLDERSARGHDVLDQAHELAFLERALEPIRGAVGLRLVADHDEREPARERGGRGEGHGAEYRRGEANGLRLALADGRRDPVAERAEEVGARLEAELVEVVARPLAGAEQEVALEVRRGDDALAEAPRRSCLSRRQPETRRASGSSRADSGEPGPNVTKEPSSK